MSRSIPTRSDAGWEVVVAPDDAGERLDRFLAGALRMSRGYARRLLARGGVQLNAGPAPKGARVRTADVIRGPVFRHPSEGPPSDAELELAVLEESGGLIAVDKPAGVPTHPLDYDETGTVLNALLARHPSMAAIGEGGLRCGMVHRLDVGTSGVLVFATEPRAWARAREAFAARLVRKRYVARVHGRHLSPVEAVLRLQHSGPRMRVVTQGGRQAITRVRTLREDDDTCLVEAFPVTGIMHQIRVTLAHLGHPVVGDLLYGSGRTTGRHLLHSAEIGIGDFQAASPPPLEITEPPGPARARMA